MRELGDSYARNEFKSHKKAQIGQVHKYTYIQHARTHTHIHTCVCTRTRTHTHTPHVIIICRSVLAIIGRSACFRRALRLIHLRQQPHIHARITHSRMHAHARTCTRALSSCLSTDQVIYKGMERIRVHDRTSITQGSIRS